MAKKTKSTSYAPNPSLIAGEAVARKYQSGSGGESTKAFTEGFMTTYMAGVAEKKIREAKLDAAISKIPNINSWRALDSGANKQAVKMWAREQKDEYARLYEIYDKTKERDVKDQMDNIADIKSQAKTDNMPGQDGLEFRVPQSWLEKYGKKPREIGGAYEGSFLFDEGLPVAFLKKVHRD